MYDRKIFKSVRFDFPVIGVGNLSAGGTGKSPHIEYLIFALQYNYKVATLSRGYGRTTHGFVMAQATSSAAEVGDEPRQFKKHFPDTAVAVCEDRVLGLPRLLSERPDVEVVLLDDAFQHRAIRPGLSILVTDYSNIFVHDELLPVGWLREHRDNYHRADVIIVTKCPVEVSEQERSDIIKRINPYKYQKVYFSTIQYGPLYSFTNPAETMQLDKETDVLLVCGIARNRPLRNYLHHHANHVYMRDYKDHHLFDRYDLEAIRETFVNLGNVKKVIVTTEKDAARFDSFRDWFLQNKIEIFVQPIAVSFLNGDAEKFTSDIYHYVETTRQKMAANN